MFEDTFDVTLFITALFGFVWAIEKLTVIFLLQ